MSAEGNENYREMKSKYIARCCFVTLVNVFCFSGCHREGHNDKGKKISVTEGKVVSRDDLIGKELFYADKKITVSGYLFTHEEGPWLASDPSRPLVNVLTLKISDESKIVPKDKSQYRWWYEYQDGYPVLVSGHFRVGDYTTSAGKSKINHPYLEVAIAQEVDSSNPEWRSSQSR